jgi:hypothetical protein
VDIDQLGPQTSRGMVQFLVTSSGFVDLFAVISSLEASTQSGWFINTSSSSEGIPTHSLV